MRGWQPRWTIHARTILFLGVAVETFWKLVAAQYLKLYGVQFNNDARPFVWEHVLGHDSFQVVD